MNIDRDLYLLCLVLMRLLFEIVLINICREGLHFSLENHCFLQLATYEK